MANMNRFLARDSIQHA